MKKMPANEGIFFCLCDMEQIKFILRENETFIPLIQLLKAVHVVYSGNEAQEVVAAGYVTRNGQTELRKRAKITAGETIVFQNYEIKVFSA